MKRFDERVPGRVQFLRDRFRRQPILRGRAVRRIRLEVDDCEPALGAQRRFQFREIFAPVADVVIRIYDKRDIDGLGKIGRVRVGQHWNQIDQVVMLRSLAKVAHHVRLDTGGEHFALGNAPGDSNTEISSAGADVGDKRGPLKTQGVQNFFRLLPCVACRVIELFGPFFRVFETAMEGAIRCAVCMMARMAATILVLHTGRRLRGRIARRYRAPCDYEGRHNRQYLLLHFAPPFNVRASVALRGHSSGQQFLERQRNRTGNTVPDDAQMNDSTVGTPHKAAEFGLADGGGRFAVNLSDDIADADTRRGG